MPTGSRIFYEPSPELESVQLAPATPLPIYASSAYSKTNAAVDAFGRSRVSQTFTLFDSQQQYDKQPLLWDENTVGAGVSTHIPAESATSLNVTTTGDSVVRQTREYFRYKPGKSQL